MIIFKIITIYDYDIIIEFVINFYYFFHGLRVTLEWVTRVTPNRAIGNRLGLIDSNFDSWFDCKRWRIDRQIYGISCKGRRQAGKIWSIQKIYRFLWVTGIVDKKMAWMLYSTNSWKSASEWKWQWNCVNKKTTLRNILDGAFWNAIHLLFWGCMSNIFAIILEWYCKSNVIF